MSVPDILFARGLFALAAAAPITGAAPQVVNSNPVMMNDVSPGTLSAHINVLADTNTLTITAKWQVFDKGGNWIDVVNGSQNAAAVAMATGTAGADAHTLRVLPAPEAVYAYRQCRVVFTSGTGVGGGAGVDEVTQCDFYYRRPSF